MIFLSGGTHSILESGVCRHSARYRHLFDACVLRRLDEFLHQSFDDVFLDGSAQIGLVFLDEILVFLQFVSQKIQETGLQSAEAVVVAWDVRLAELERVGVAFLGQFVDDRASGIA